MPGSFALVANGTLLVIPEVADYEVRRELLRRRATAGLRRLDDFEARFLYLPISTPAIRRARRVSVAVLHAPDGL